MGYIVCVLAVLALIGLKVFATASKEQAKKTGDEPTKVPMGAYIAIAMFGFIGFSFGAFNQVAFYAEPSYNYHVRTIMGTEKFVMGETGYRFYWFGPDPIKWKRAISVRSVGCVAGADNDGIQEESQDGNSNTSASLIPQEITFLDQVDADGCATVRFRLPTDPETFKKLVHEYRSPENLLRTELIPAFEETFKASGSLMTAEEYYSGGRTQFNSDFEKQMKDGIFLVRRVQERVVDETAVRKATANASMGEDQEDYEKPTKLVYKVERLVEEDGVTPQRKPQNFKEFGIVAIKAQVTDMIPNSKFKSRMDAKQDAAAKRAVAIEQRIEQEEQRRLKVAEGERMVAERQASALVEQIEATTNAETKKQLAITAASQKKEQAEIDKQTMQIALETAQLEAKKIKTLADAKAYDKRKQLEADGQIQLLVDAAITMNRDMANAMAKRPVPQNLYISGGGSTGGMGNDSDLMQQLQLMNMAALKQLGLGHKGGNITIPKK